MSCCSHSLLFLFRLSDNSTLTVASSFLSSSQSVSSTAIQSATAASQIQVVGNEVRGYGTAVMMQGGGTVQENTFTDNNAAFIFSGTGGFEFVQNVLDSNHNDVVITQGVGWVVEDNNCVGTLGSSSFICSSGPCINAGNIGCEFTTTEGDKKASEQIALA
jgi:hypothetical protein